MNDIIVGIDAGTSVIKSVAFSLEGKQLAIAAIKNEYRLTANGGAEQNLPQTWHTTAATLIALGEKIPDLGQRVAAIAVTGQGDGTWLVDKKGEAVRDGLLWLDSRAADIADEITGAEGNRRRFELSGTGLMGCQQGPQLRWLIENEPEAIAQTETAMHCKDWLYYKLTGELATDPSEGVFSFGDFRTREYSSEVLEILGLDHYRHLLPPIVEGTRHTGGLNRAAAAASGLPEGTPVILGYVDVICTGLGSGLYATSGDRGCSIVGSTGMHMRLSRSADEVKLNDDCTGYTMSMPVPGVYTQMQSNMAATLNIDWLLDMVDELLKSLGVSKAREELLSSLDHWVASARPATLLYQPYVSSAGERGPFIDSNARAGFIGLCSQHGFYDVARAIFEGLSLAARDCYLAMGSLPTELVVSGGAARSRQLLAITGACLEAGVQTSSREEAGAAGAAMMAAVAIGQYETMDDCITQWVNPLMGEVLTPDSALVECYRSVYPAYAQSHRALRPVWKTLAAHQKQLAEQ
ncbi:carbohydrate kinase [Chromatiales bacterium (ex Bugula neritina AB1)]|nr:carbohydrate kinase [Chromatiales bacterium (ex Bugula neritina AB1)]